MSWTGHDTALVVWAAVGIAVIVVLITRSKVHPFIALIVGSGVVGLATGLKASEVVKQFESGFGSTLGGVGILVALGTMLGKLLADSGGADRIVSTILGWGSERRLPWAMTLIAMIIGIPLFFEVGVVLLMPVILLMTRRSGTSIVRVGLPALAGLSVMHGFVPPHPGPLIAIDALRADLGQTMALGLLLAIPTVVVAGPLYGIWIGRRVRPEPPARLVEQFAAAGAAPAGDAPGFGVTLATILLPVALMLGKAVADVLLPARSGARGWIDFLGDPLLALLISVLVAMFTLGYRLGFSRQRVSDLLGGSLGPIAGIVMIIGAGGGFKQMLIASGIGDAIGKAAAQSAISPLLLGWLIAVGIRLGTGSATVATVTASGLMAPIVRDLQHVSTPLLALAIGAGSVFFSHVNDAGFWLVKEYFGMTVGETLATWSAMETILSVVGLALVLVAGIFV
ncbi:MAG TPA: gluconate:H+ symporter [Anaeromyxobacteraceae bacterium]|nr:gluconate:H+ symporter [Anaeromyxobacteraceae bacterium]